MKFSFKIIFLSITILCLFCFNNVFAQNNIELKYANSLNTGIYKGKNVRKLLGNCEFKLGEIKIICDTAYQYDDKNETELFGNIKFVFENKTTFISNRAIISIVKQKVILWNNVIIEDSNLNIKTQKVKYNLENKIAKIAPKSTVIQNYKIIKSNKMKYNLIKQSLE